MPVQIASIILLPNNFQIVNPPELIGLTIAVLQNKSLDNEQIKYAMDKLWSDWYVICSVSGEYISLNTLKYWNVLKQEMYARPELVPQ